MQRMRDQYLITKLPFPLQIVPLSDAHCGAAMPTVALLFDQSLIRPQDRGRLYQGIAQVASKDESASWQPN